MEVTQTEWPLMGQKRNFDSRPVPSGHG